MQVSARFKCKFLPEFDGMSGPPGYAFQPVWTEEELEARERDREREQLVGGDDSDEEGAPEPPPAPERLGNNNWCQCGNCPPMPTARECICCREMVRCRELQLEGCVTDHADFHDVCLTRAVSRVFSVARRDIRGHRARVRGQAPQELNNK